MTKLGRELRKIRLDLGITLYEMATAIGISSAMLSSIETGKKPAPSNLIDKLASEYEAVKGRKTEFVNLANETKNEVRIVLGERSDANELAFAFARKFDSLSSAEISQLMSTFNKSK